MEQLAQQQRIISQLRNENRELKDNEIMLKKKVVELEARQFEKVPAIRHTKKQIFHQSESPIK